MHSRQQMKELFGTSIQTPSLLPHPRLPRPQVTTVRSIPSTDDGQCRWEAYLQQVMGMTKGAIASTGDVDDSGEHTFYRRADAASPASPMQVLYRVLRRPQVVDMAHSWQVQAPSRLGSGYQ